jgi:catechol 2,3-dioxygenase-like lactoylglutathione lyase family enzyme
MLDHISLRVTDFERAKAFYLKALAPLGYEVIMEFPGAAGLGVKPKPDFWITQVEGGATTTTTHIAFAAANRRMVQAFYDAALAAGGKDNGKPGTRPEYHEHYFGAFVLDPDGHNIEACIHTPE